MNKKFCFSLALAIIPIFFNLSAREGIDYYYKNIGLGDGLSQASVTSVSADRNGSLWIGTKYGLNLYRNQRLSLVGSFGCVNHIYSQDDGSIWVCSNDGLYRGDCDLLSFSAVDSRNTLCAVELSESIYFGCEGGVGIYDGSNYSFYALDGGYVTALYEFDGTILAVDKGLGLYEFNPGSPNEPFCKSDWFDSKDYVLMSSALCDDTLYLGLYRRGLMILNLKDGSSRILHTSNFDISYDIILSMMVYKDELWLGTDGGGIDIYSLKTKKISRLPMPSNSIISLYRDSYSNIWAGTVSSGLYGLRPSQILSFDRDNSALAYNVVQDVCSDDDSNVWIGTDGGGVCVYDGSQGTLRSFPATYGLKVSSIEKMDGDKLLLSLYNEGLRIFNYRTGRMSPFVLVDKETNDRQFFYGNSPEIYRLEDGHYLILAISVYDYDSRTGTFTPFVCDFSDLLYDLEVCGQEGDTIYAYNVGGVFALDRKTHNVRQLSVSLDNIAAAAYGDGTIWMGNSTGLYRYDVKESGTEKINTNLFERVTYLKYVSSGDLWIAADNTLFKQSGQVIKLVGENEGVGANELTCGEEVVIGDIPTLFLGGSNGVLKISLGSGTSRAVDAKSLVLSSVNLDGDRLDIKNGRLSIKDQYSQLALNVTLAPSDPFERNVYRYSVSGRSEYSVETYSDNMTFPELNDGTYNIDVSYFKNDGQWSEPVRILTLKVLPPWYRSTWFVIALTIVLMGAVIALMLLLYRRKVRVMQRNLRATNRDFVEKIDSYILSNLSDSALDVQSIATYMAMSRASLYSKFKSVMGCGIGEYIDSLRMKEACRLLSETRVPITEVAERVGYSNSGYFSTRFKKIIGRTPREYRAK